MTYSKLTNKKNHISMIHNDKPKGMAVEGLHSLPKCKVIMDWQAIQTPVFFDNTSFCFRNINYISKITTQLRKFMNFSHKVTVVS